MPDNFIEQKSKPRGNENRTEQKIMMAAALGGPRNVELVKRKVPEPGENDVLFRVEGCGMCASTIPKWQGREWFHYPMEAGDPGHEAYGVVERTGSAVKNVKPGDRIAAISSHALAEYDLTPADHVVKIPAELGEIPFPGEPLGCAMNIFERSQIREGDTVAIVGIGFLGALLIQLAKERGAEVIAISQRDYSLEVASEMGADHLIPLDDHYRIIEKVKEITGGNFCNKVIECTGKEQPLNLCGELTAVRGRLIIAGFHQGGMRSINLQLWNWRGIDVINAHERDPARYVEGMEAAIKATLSGRWNFTPLLTHSFYPDQIPTAFEMLENRPEGFIKSIINFTSR